jgi:hypothetical protein
MAKKEAPTVGRLALLNCGLSLPTVEVRVLALAGKRCKVDVTWIPPSYNYEHTLRSKFPRWVKTRKLRLIDLPPSKNPSGSTGPS